VPGRARDQERKPSFDDVMRPFSMISGVPDPLAYDCIAAPPVGRRLEAPSRAIRAAIVPRRRERVQQVAEKGPSA